VLLVQAEVLPNAAGEATGVESPDESSNLSLMSSLSLEAKLIREKLEFWDEAGDIALAVWACQEVVFVELGEELILGLEVVP
jgi:hypothetical protein